jgi:hypothetical protein
MYYLAAACQDTKLCCRWIPVMDKSGVDGKGMMKIHDATPPLWWPMGEEGDTSRLR